MEPEVGTPGLVGDQGYTPAMCHFDQAGDVGTGAEVGRGNDDGSGRIRAPLERLGKVIRSQAMGHPQFRVEFGCGEGRFEAGHDHSVDHRGMYVSLNHKFATHVGHGEAHRLVSLGGTIDQKPGPFCSPGFGGELLGLLEGVLIPDVDSLDQGRNVIGKAGLSGEQQEAFIGADATLVTGNVEPARVALGELEQGIDVGGAILA